MKGFTKVKPHKWSCDVRLVRHFEGRKEEKGEEIKGKAIRPFGAVEEWRVVPECEDRCSVEELQEWEQVKEEKNIVIKRKLWEIHSKEESGK